MLAVSGQLTSRLHGPSVFPPLPAEVLATASRPDGVWGKSSPEDFCRRSIYVFVKRSLRTPLLAGLDQPDPDLPCPERFPTNVPTQALMTLNSDFTQKSAAHFARRLVDVTDGLDECIARAVWLALGRPPKDGEVVGQRKFLDRLTSEHSLETDRSLEVFCLALLNLNEFMWVD